MAEPEELKKGAEKKKSKKSNTVKWSASNNVGIVGGLALILLTYIPFEFFPRSFGDSLGVVVWILVMLFMLLILESVGSGFTGVRFKGFLIDRRNMLSLSKLQMLLWTLLVMSGYITMVQILISNDIKNPLDVGIPATLWALMGISTASLIGSPLIKNDNFGATIIDTSENDPKDSKTAAIKNLGLENDPGIDIVGTEVVNKSPKNSSFRDLFRGEEVGNFLQPDFGKLQMFLFTFIVWFAYAIFIYQLLVKMQVHAMEINSFQSWLSINSSNTSALIGINASREALSGLRDFPDISGGMATMLAISNAGYLAFKGISREKAPEKP